MPTRRRARRAAVGGDRGAVLRSSRCTCSRCSPTNPVVGGDVAERLFAQSLSLPSGSRISDEMVAWICDRSSTAVATPTQSLQRAGVTRSRGGLPPGSTPSALSTLRRSRSPSKAKISSPPEVRASTMQRVGVREAPAAGRRADSRPADVARQFGSRSRRSRRAGCRTTCGTRCSRVRGR